MNEAGISMEEACRTGAMTDEDFELGCNPDGTVRDRAETVTLSRPGNPEQSVEVPVWLLWSGGAVIVVATLAAVVALVWLTHRKKK